MYVGMYYDFRGGRYAIHSQVERGTLVQNRFDSCPRDDWFLVKLCPSAMRARAQMAMLATYNCFDCYIRLFEAKWHNLRLRRALQCHGLWSFRFTRRCR